MCFCSSQSIHRWKECGSIRECAVGSIKETDQCARLRQTPAYEDFSLVVEYNSPCMIEIRNVPMLQSNCLAAQEPL